MRENTGGTPQREESVLAMTSIRSHRIAIILFVGLLSSTPTYAYIDPGTGSVLLQGLLAGIAVALGVARTYWQRIKAFFSPSRANPVVETTTSQGADPEGSTPESEV